MEGSEDSIYSQKVAIFEKLTVEPVGMLPERKRKFLNL